MATADDVLNVARSQLGVVESPPGSNQVLYASWAGIPGRAWCAAFACWVLERAGALDVARFVNCQTGVDLYRAAGRFGPDPHPGALVFFQWPGVGRACHVGFIEAPRPDGGVTIEGNTDEAGGGSGGKVMRHVRRANIVGYGYPILAVPVAPAAPASPVPGPPIAARPVLRQGASGGYVRLLQAKLGVTADSIFGPQTKKAVVAFQKARGLAADGIVGPQTWGALG